jgi:hypothetical protein
MSHCMMHACRITCRPRLLLGGLKKLKHLKFGVSQTNYDPRIISRWGTEYTDDTPFLPHLESLHIWAVDDCGWADEIVGMKDLRSLCIEQIQLSGANPSCIIDKLNLDEKSKPYLRICKFGAFVSPEQPEVFRAYGFDVIPSVQRTDASAITDDLHLMDFAKKLPHCVIETNWETYEHRQFAKTTKRFVFQRRPFQGARA